MTAPAALDLSVIVPCFNEEDNLTELVERTERVFERRGIAGEIVLVDDGSHDGTGRLADALAASRAHVVAPHHPTNRGIPEGWKTGLAHARGRYVCTIDADLQYQPEGIALLYREMCFSNADLVQGWRSSLELRRYDVRYYMSRGLDHLLKLVFAMHEHDVKSGFVIYRREAFEEILAHAPGYFYIQHLITVVAKAKGYSIRQVETLFLERRAGRSFIGLFPLKMIARTLVDIARAAVEFRLRETKDQSLSLALQRRTGAGAPRGAPGAARRGPSSGTSRNTRAYLAELDRTQWLPPDELCELQLRRLQRLVRHAYQHVGYYRELLQTAGIAPDDVRSLEDLRKLPVLGRHALRENLFFDLFADTYTARNVVKITTSGATGEPLVFFADRFQLEMRSAHAARGAGWAGHRPGTRHARWVRGGFTGRPIDAAERLGARLSRGRLFAGFVLDDALVRRWTEYVRTGRPTVMAGDAELFDAFAGIARASNHDARGAAAVHTWGQTLGAAARRSIVEAFGCPVFDEYGAQEVGPLAHECDAHAGLHVNAESYIVEIVRDGRPAGEGEIGDVLVTDLNSRTVPLIRYQLPDLAVATRRACACGRGLPLIGGIVGRPPSAVLDARGRCVPGTVFAEVFRDHEHAVSRYHVSQEQPGVVTVRLVRKSRFTADTERSLREVLAGVLGAHTRVTLEPVDALPVSPGAPDPTCVSALAVPLTRAADPAGRPASIRVEVSR